MVEWVVLRTSVYCVANETPSNSFTVLTDSAIWISLDLFTFARLTLLMLRL